LQLHLVLPSAAAAAAGDKSAMVPGGMRIGTPALTTRGFKEDEFVQVADFIDRAVKIAKDCQAKTPAPGRTQRHDCGVDAVS
jgi:glycine/serine hydroxymethyltransferase